MSVLELRNVSKVYGQGPTEVRALRGIDLSVEAGTMVAVMKPVATCAPSAPPGRAAPLAARSRPPPPEPWDFSEPCWAPPWRISPPSHGSAAA
jgi:hypothetical protein